MVSMTLSIPEELKQDMDLFQDMNWSAVARTAIQQKIVYLKKFKEFTKNSTLTEDDALRMGKELNKSLTKRYLSTQS